jgi:hypothetical protein
MSLRASCIVCMRSRTAERTCTANAERLVPDECFLEDDLYDMAY